MSTDTDRTLPRDEPNITDEQEASFYDLADHEDDRIAELAQRGIDAIKAIREGDA